MVGLAVFIVSTVIVLYAALYIGLLLVGAICWLFGAEKME